MKRINNVDLGIALAILPPLFLFALLGLYVFAGSFGDPGVLFRLLMSFMGLVAIVGIIIGVPVGMAIVLYSVIGTARSREQRRTYERDYKTPTAA